LENSAAQMALAPTPEELALTPKALAPTPKALTPTPKAITEMDSQTTTLWHSHLTPVDSVPYSGVSWAGNGCI
jgi:hypothetical protein